MVKPDEGEQDSFWPRDPHRFLKHGQITACQMLPWGSNCVYVVAICWEEEEGLAIYKPRSGEEPLWDFPSGTLYRREYAAYVVSEALGWHLVPPTVIRDGPQGIGSVQLYREPAGQAIQRAADRFQRELMRLAVLDVITNNADRKAAHFLVGKDGRLWGIDHGLTFNEDYRLRTVLWELTSKPVPQEYLSELRVLQGCRSELTRRLRALLTEDEVEVFWKRWQKLLDRPVFPRPIPYGYAGFF
jgi:hypothetical protein